MLQVSVLQGDAGSRAHRVWAQAAATSSMRKEGYLTVRTISLVILLYMVRNKMPPPVTPYMPLAHRSVILRCLDAHHISSWYLTLLSRLQGKVDYLA